MGRAEIGTVTHEMGENSERYWDSNVRGLCVCSDRIGRRNVGCGVLLHWMRWDEGRISHNKRKAWKACDDAIL